MPKRHKNLSKKEHVQLKKLNKDKYYINTGKILGYPEATRLYKLRKNLLKRKKQEQKYRK